MPNQFDSLGEFITLDHVQGHIRISSDIHQHIAWLQEDVSLGFERIYIHNVNRDQERFIETFGEKVLPVLHS